MTATRVTLLRRALRKRTAQLADVDARLLEAVELLRDVAAGDAAWRSAADDLVRLCGFSPAARRRRAPCETCGRPVTMSRICQLCRLNVSRSLVKVL